MLHHLLEKKGGWLVGICFTVYGTYDSKSKPCQGFNQLEKISMELKNTQHNHVNAELLSETII